MRVRYPYVTLPTSTRCRRTRTLAGPPMAATGPFLKGPPMPITPHDPTLLAILDRREPVTLAEPERVQNPNADPRMQVKTRHDLGDRLTSAAYCVCEFSDCWPDALAWNLTIAALLGVAARRALYNTNVCGGL